MALEFHLLKLQSCLGKNWRRDCFKVGGGHESVLVNDILRTSWFMSAFLELGSCVLRFVCWLLFVVKDETNKDYWQKTWFVAFVRQHYCWIEMSVFAWRVGMDFRFQSVPVFCFVDCVRSVLFLCVGCFGWTVMGGVFSWCFVIDLILIFFVVEVGVNNSGLWACEG